MTNTIKLKRGSGSDPQASDLVVGEVAVRTDEGKLFTKKDDGSVAEISGGGSGTTINNNADNRVITGSGTANTLNGESSFTYDGAGVLTLLSTDTSSSALPIIELYRNSASPADADYLGQLKFTGESDDGSKEVYAKMTAKIDDASSGTEDGLFEFALRKAGSNNICGRFTSTTFKLLNGTGLQLDDDNTKLEIGDSQDTALFHDGTDSFIKQATATPLKIQGAGSNGADVHIQARPDEEGIKLSNNSGESKVEIYYDNTKRIETTDYGSLTSGVHSVSNGIMEMKQEIATSHTFTSGYNAVSVDPTVASGVTVTVPSGATWSIV